MLEKIEVLINIGTGNIPEKVSRRIRTVNMMAFIAASLSFIYAVLYFLFCGAVPTIVNLLAMFFYILVFFLNYYEKREGAKALIIAVYLLQLFILTKFIFSSATGFHYFFLVLPPLSFLIFAQQQRIAKLLTCLVPIAIFFICDVIEIASPFIPLSEAVVRVSHLSSVMFIFSGLFLIIYVFADNIKENEEALEDSIRKLEKAVSEIKTLKGLIPICSNCKKIRDDKGFWNNFEAHIQEHSDATFSHGTCPECLEELYGEEDWYHKLKKSKLQQD